jgi:hypothetical protein
MRNLARLSAVGASTAILAAGLVTPAQAAATSWGACPAGPGIDARQECATLQVPMDYQAPGGPTTSLAMSRIKTAKPALRP